MVGLIVSRDFTTLSHVMCRSSLMRSRSSNHPSIAIHIRCIEYTTQYTQRMIRCMLITRCWYSKHFSTNNHFMSFYKIHRSFNQLYDLYKISTEIRIYFIVIYRSYTKILPTYPLKFVRLWICLHVAKQIWRGNKIREEFIYLAFSCIGHWLLLFKNDNSNALFSSVVQRQVYLSDKKILSQCIQIVCKLLVN